MGSRRRETSHPPPLRSAAMVLLALLVSVAPDAASARAPWCDDLPLSLETTLYGVGCDAEADAHLAAL